MENLGNVTITPEVVKQIVLEAIKEIEDVKGISSPDGKMDFTKLFKSNDKKSLEVEMGENECVVELSIAVAYGSKLQEVSKTVQETVTKSVEDLTGIKVKEVNVTVVKVVKEEPTEEEVIDEGEEA